MMLTEASAFCADRMSSITSKQIDTYCSNGIGSGSMLKEDIDDVSVALLCCLVQRCVSILKMQSDSFRNSRNEGKPNGINEKY